MEGRFGRRPPREPPGEDPYDPDVEPAFAWPGSRVVGEGPPEHPVGGGRGSPSPQRPPGRARERLAALREAITRRGRGARGALAALSTDRLGGRRSRLVVVVALGVIAAAGLGVALLVGGDDRLSKRDRAVIEAAAPGGSSRPEGAVGASAAARRVAARLPLPRQVAQLFAVDMVGQYPRDPFFGQLRRRHWGAVVVGPANFVDEGQMTALTGELRVVARQSGALPPLIAASQSGGPASTFPALPPRAPAVVGNTGRPGVARSQARAAGAALARLGINMNLGPVADVGTPAGPVQDQVFSDEVPVVTRMVAAALAGYRSRGVIAAVGHFPGIGGASADPDLTTATVGLSLAELRRRDLRPFAAIARQVPVIILANAVYAAFDGVTPAVLEPEVTARLLRRDLGFRGVAMTSDLNSTAAVIGKDVGNVAVGAFVAGSDLLYVSGGGPNQERAYQAVLRAVRDGTISRERLRLSVLRVVALKQRYGLLPRGTRRRAARRRSAARPPGRRRGAKPPRTPVAGPPAPGARP